MTMKRHIIIILFSNVRFYFCFIKVCFNAHTPVVAVIQNSELCLFSTKKLKTVVAAAFDCHIIKKRTFREVSY